MLLLDVDKSAPRVVVFSPLGDVVTQHPFERLLNAHADSACRFIGTWKDMLYVADVGECASRRQRVSLHRHVERHALRS